MAKHRKKLQKRKDAVRGIEPQLLRQVGGEYGRGGFSFGGLGSMRQEDAEMMDAQQPSGDQYQTDPR